MCSLLGLDDDEYFSYYYDENSTNPKGNTNTTNCYATITSLLLPLLMLLLLAREGVNGNALRLAYYPHANKTVLSASDGSDGSDGNCIRYGAHTDYQGTVIMRSLLLSVLLLLLGYTILRPDPLD